MIIGKNYQIREMNIEKKELEDKLGKFKSIYNRLLVNNNSSSDISPKPIKGNCVFFE